MAAPPCGRLPLLPCAEAAMAAASARCGGGALGGAALCGSARRQRKSVQVLPQRAHFAPPAVRRALCRAAQDAGKRGSSDNGASASDLSSAASGSNSQATSQEIDCVGTGSNVECVVAPSVQATSQELDCVGTGSDVECFVADIDRGPPQRYEGISKETASDVLPDIIDTLILISPFFFWGTAMVAMKEVLPKAGPAFVAAVRLIPAGALLVAFAAARGRKLPDTGIAWLAISVFALVDGTCFQGCLSEGLRRTSAGLGSVIIDSQPLTVAVLAALLFGETIGKLGVAGLFLGVLGLCLLEIPVEAVQSLVSSDSLAHMFQQFSVTGGDSESVVPFSLWDSGEWWMLLAAQSMAVGTVLVRWVCRYSDPVMATGLHMILGGVPLLLLSIQQGDPVFTGHVGELSALDWSALVYTSIFGSAISYGVFFYNANKGNLTKLSSLTFLTPMFAAFFGYIYLGETLSPWQLVGALVTVVAITLVNVKVEDAPADKKLP